MSINSKKEIKNNLIEKGFELVLWKSRFLVLIPVFVSLNIFILLIIGICLKLFKLIYEIWYFGFSDKVLSGIISILDISLLAVIILIFGWGIYELFVSEININDHHISKAKSLIIKDIDELKEKIGKVIIILLIVWLFKQMILQVPQNQLQILTLALAILVMALALKFISGKK